MNISSAAPFLAPRPPLATANVDKWSYDFARQTKHTRENGARKWGIPGVKERSCGDFQDEEEGLAVSLVVLPEIYRCPDLFSTARTTQKGTYAC